MVKVLIYSSKEIYDNSSYEGRAEADVIAYATRNDYGSSKEYKVVKDRTGKVGLRTIFADQFQRHYIRWIENDEWNREVEAIELQAKYKDHPLMELSKNG